MKDTEEMHLVLLNQHYPPDPGPTGVMLEAVAERLAEAGFRVTVLCGQGTYTAPVACESSSNTERDLEAVQHESQADSDPEEARPRRVNRIAVAATRFKWGATVGKLLNYLTFYLAVAWNLATITPRPTRIVALTTPPYLSVLARIFSKLRGGDHAHWVMDLYPDVMVSHGMLHQGSLLQRGLGALARWGFGGDRSAAVVTLGPDMARALSEYVPDRQKVDWVPLWLTAPGGVPSPLPSVKQMRPRRREQGWEDGETVFLYSGNMGLGHRFDEFLKVAATGTDAAESAPMRFVFCGGGHRRCEIEAYQQLADKVKGSAPGIPVELRNYVPGAELSAHLLSADVHLVSLEPSWDGTVVPSKLQGSFSVGRPVIFVGSRTCSIGHWIIESEGGWVVPSGDVAGLRRAMNEALNADERTRRGSNAARFASENFDRETNARRVAQALTKSMGFAAARMPTEEIIVRQQNI